MSTAVPTPTAPPISPFSPRTRLVLASVFGAVVVLGGLFVAGYFVPTLWDTHVAPRLGKGSGFLNVVLRLTSQVVAAAAIIWVGTRLAGANPPKGLRGGIFVVISVLFTLFFLVRAIGLNLESLSVGLYITAALGIVLALLFVRFLLGDRANRYMLDLEHAGWLHTHSYKPSQGVTLRRLSLIGVLLLGFSGVWSLVSHNSIAADEQTKELTLRIPFTLHPKSDDRPANTDAKPAEVPTDAPKPKADTTEVHRTIPLLPAAETTLPLLLVAAVFWFGWRLVNVPAFADFLINTEAEMNKVSWSSKKRLAQDTVVVLVTVVLLTVFLLAIDLFWGWLLSRELIRVLPSSTSSAAAQQSQSDTPDW